MLFASIAVKFPLPPRFQKLVLVVTLAVAVRFQSSSIAEPPLSLVTVLTSLRNGGTSSLFMVQVTLTPTGTSILFGPVKVPPSQDQLPSV